MKAPLSNRLADLAERAGMAWRHGHGKSVEAARLYLEAGALLLEAKAECAHGEWLPTLERAGIAPRTAQRLMRLTGSGMTADTLAEYGVKAAVATLASPPSNASRVAHLTEPPRPAVINRTRERRAAWRMQGRCVDCGQPSEGMARCQKHRKAVAQRDRRRRALARTGEALAPRLAEAAKAGTGLALSAGEVAALTDSEQP